MATRDSAAPRYWIGVVSYAHVQNGIAGGFAQLSHGKEAPLRRLHQGDFLVYYSPRTEYGGGVPLQAFTAIGRVTDDRIYSHRMGDDFVPFRRDVTYVPCQIAPIAPLLARLSFIRDKQRWGYHFRGGLIQISAEDFVVISEAMTGAAQMAQTVTHAP